MIYAEFDQFGQDIEQDIEISIDIAMEIET